MRLKEAYVTTLSTAVFAYVSEASLFTVVAHSIRLLHIVATDLQSIMINFQSVAVVRRKPVAFYVAYKVQGYILTSRICHFCWR
jgi:hypothetical protein